MKDLLHKVQSLRPDFGIIQELVWEGRAGMGRGKLKVDCISLPMSQGACLNWTFLPTHLRLAYKY